MDMQRVWICNGYAINPSQLSMNKNATIHSFSNTKKLLLHIQFNKNRVSLNLMLRQKMRKPDSRISFSRDFFTWQQTAVRWLFLLKATTFLSLIPGTVILAINKMHLQIYTTLHSKYFECCAAEMSGELFPNVPVY